MKTKNVQSLLLGAVLGSVLTVLILHFYSELNRDQHASIAIKKDKIQSSDSFDSQSQPSQEVNEVVSIPKDPALVEPAAQSKEDFDDFGSADDIKKTLKNHFESMAYKDFKNLLGINEERLPELREFANTIIGRKLDLSSFAGSNNTSIKPEGLTRDEIDAAFEQLKLDYADGLSSLLTPTEIETLKDAKTAAFNRRFFEKITNVTTKFKFAVRDLSNQQLRQIENITKRYLEQGYVAQLSLIEIFVGDDLDDGPKGHSQLYIDISDELQNLLSESQQDQYDMYDLSDYYDRTRDKE